LLFSKQNCAFPCFFIVKKFEAFERAQQQSSSRLNNSYQSDSLSFKAIP
jgi:hypothetical protein